MGNGKTRVHEFDSSKMLNWNRVS